MRKGPELPDRPADQDRLLEPRFMHPAIFIPANVSIGVLYALHDWIYMRQWDGYHNSASLALAEWGMQFLLWGTICWLMWCFMRSAIERANLKQILTLFVPFSLFLSVIEEIVWVFLFPHIPMKHPQWSFLERLGFNLEGDVTQSLPIFWCSFFLFRGVGYYQKFREKESAAAQLEVQLVNAQMAALRMQLNPHFLFNTMNSISSLMRFDIDAADTMLEQLSSLLRITLERGDIQLISLRDEIDFIEVYLAMQGRRYAGRVNQSVSVEPDLHDALVPAMLLQPIVENAFAHGLSRVEANGILSLDVRRDGNEMRIRVRNSGVGLKPVQAVRTDGHGVGLSNVKSRLRLHYGEGWSLTLSEVESKQVEAVVLLPLQFAQHQQELVAQFGV
jgi:anti-sigma regulatory factor (Ser/Thr protein kinase)